MYDATLVYCSDYLNFVNFIPEDINRDGKIYEEDAYDGFRKIIKRHIQLYENEPLFQIFTFVHSEKYFNKNAAEIAENELIKIERGIAELVKGFAEKEKPTPSARRTAPVFRMVCRHARPANRPVHYAQERNRTAKPGKRSRKPFLPAHRCIRP